MQTKTLDILPPETTRHFLNSQPLPDDLRLHRSNESPITWDNLLAHCSNILKFLQNNKVHNTYVLRSPCFVDTFAEFNKIYHTPSTDPEIMNKKLKLIDIERYIHMVIEMKATHDLSPYLRLVEEFCFDDRLDEIISPVYWKYESWIEGYGELYMQFLNFLAPYMEYLSHKKFEFTKIFEEVALDETYVQKCLTNLQTSLMSKGIQDEFQLERVTDHNYGLEFIEKAKNALLEKSTTKDTQFYYDLGLCSLIFHLYKLAKENSTALLNICLSTALHKGKTVNLGSTNAGKSLKKTLQEITAAGVTEACWSDFLSELCFNLSQSSLNEREKDKLMHILRNLLLFISQQSSKESSLLVVSKKSSKLLLFDVLEVIENSKDSMAGCEFTSDHPNCAFALLEAISRLFGVQPVIKEAETQNLIYEKLQSISKVKGLDPITLDRCFSTMQNLANLSKDIGNKVITNWNFSETSLSDIIFTTKDDSELKINLKYTFGYFKERIPKEPLQEKETNELISLYKTFIAFIAKAGEDSDKVSDNQVAKVLGIFLLRFANLKIEGINDVRKEFLVTFISFLNEKCTLDKWEISYFQQDLWEAVQKQANIELNISEELLEKLLNTFEIELAKAQITSSTFAFRDQGINEEKTKYQIYNVIMSFIDDLTAKMSGISKKINWSTICSSEESKNVADLLMQSRRFTYFALPWVNYFVKTVNPSKKEEAGQKFAALFSKTCRLHFDPTFVLLVEKREREPFKQLYQNAIENSTYSSWYYQLATFDALNRNWQAIKEEEKDKSIFAIPAAELKDEFSIRSFEKLNSTQHMPAVTVKLLTFILNLSRIPELTKYSEPILDSQAESDETLKLIKQSLESFNEYIHYVQELFILEKPGTEPDFQEGILQHFFSSVKKWFILASKVLSASGLLRDFVLRLFIEAKKDMSNTFLLEITIMIMSLTGPVLRRNIVNQIIFNNQILISLVNELSISAKAKNPSASSKRHECILKFLKELNTDSFGVLEPKYAEFLKDSPSNETKEAHDLLSDWFYRFMHEVEQFPYLEVSALANRTLVECYKGFLMIAEKFYICARKSFDEALKNVGENINKLETQLNVPHAVFGQIDEGFKFSPKVAEDTKESGDLNDILLEKKKELAALNSANEALSKRLFKKFGLYNLEYTFWKIESFDKPRLKAAVEEVPKSILAGINDVNCQVINEYQNDRTYAFEEILEQIVRQEAYLELLQRFETKYGSKSIVSLEFMRNIYDASCLLFEKLLKGEPKEIQNYNAKFTQKNYCEEKIHKVVQILAKLFLTFYAQAGCQNNTLKLTNWLKLVLKLHAHLQEAGEFTLIDHQQNSFTFLTNLMQCALYSESQAVSIILHEKSSFLNMILSQESNKLWTHNTTNQLIFILDLVLKSYLPSKTAIEADLNRIALTNSSLTIATIVNQSKLDQPFHRANGEVLATVLLDKFSVTPPLQNGNPNYTAPFTYYLVSFDPDHVPTTPKDKVQQIINEVSLNARTILDTLLDSIVENYLYNISVLSHKNDKPDPEPKLKQTSGVMTILSTLLNAHKELIVYILFTKKNFSSQIAKHRDSVHFLREVDIETFKSIAILDCLWKIQYFAINTIDAMVWIKVLGACTGIVFKSPDDPQRMLDVSHLASNWFLDNIIQELRVQDSSSVDSLTLYNTSALWTALWWNRTNLTVSIAFDKYIKGGLLSLLKEILCRIKDYTMNTYKIVGGFGDIEYNLWVQLKVHYERQLTWCILNVEKMNKLKKENYKALLEDYDYLKNEVSMHSDLAGLFEKTSSEISTVSKSLISEYEVPEEEKSFFAEKDKWFISKTEMGINRMTLMFDGSSYVISQNNWTSFNTKREAALKLLAPIYEKEEAWRLIKLRYSAPGNFTTICANIGTLLNLKFDLPAVKEDANPVSSTPFLGKITFDKKIETELKNRLPVEEEKKEQSTTTELTQSTIDIAPQTQDIKPTETPTKVNEPEIKYFYHPTIQTKNELEILQNKTLIRLKRLNEKVLVAFRHHQIMNTQSLFKDIVAQEVTEELKQYSKFEQNMMLCMLGEFKDFESYVYPEDIKEIKQEFELVRNNFSTYLTKLGSRTDLPEPAEDQDFTNFELSNTLDNAFQFTYESPSIQQNQPQTEPIVMSSAQRDVLKGLYLIDDAAVESVISVFYIDYKNKMSVQIPNMMNLLLELGNSVQFEVKFIDFCLFFLYCPEHLNKDIKDPNMNAFPYNRVFNIETDSDSSLSVYNLVASNILNFLKFYIPKRDYLIFQPRLFLEQHGLKSLQSLKKELGYQVKMFENVSICDMLVGLLDVKEISCNSELSIERDEILNPLLDSSNKFELLNFQESDELADRLNVLTIQSCQRFIKLKKLSVVINGIPDLILFSPKIATKCLETQIETLHSPVEKVNINLKTKLREDPGSISLADIQDVLSVDDSLKGFEQILDKVSSIMSTWILDQMNKDKKDDENNKYIEAINWFNEKFLNEKTIQEFIIHLLELLSYLSQPQLSAINESNSLVQGLIKICTHFYALTLVHSASYQLKLGPESTDALPSLSQIISHEGANELPHVPELLSTFSYIRKEMTFDFDVLYSDLCRKYKDSLYNVINDQNGKPKKEIMLIWKKLPYLVDFSKKCSNLKSLIQDDRDNNEADSLRLINIDRKNFLSTTLLEFKNKSLKELKRPLQIEYLNEEGYDGGGLRREFFSLISRELFDPKTGLFQISQNGVSIQPSQYAKIVPNYLHYLQLAGILVAKAIQDECQLDVTFTKSFLKQILGKKIAMGDLEDMDPEFTKSLKWMLENPVDELEQTFTYEEKIFGDTVIKELVPNGSEKLVTDANKKDYFKKICEFKLKDEIQEEVSAFLDGFHLIISPRFFDLFAVADLQLLISGVPTIDLKEMREHVEYSGWEEDSDTIKWFWEILEEFTQKELGAFVFFLSGSSRVGPGSFKEIPVICANTGLESPSLPLAHTCYREIEIPLYSSKEEFRQKLLVAVYEGQEGFDMR